MTDEQLAFATFVVIFGFLLPVSVVWWREKRKRRRLGAVYGAATAAPVDAPIDTPRRFNLQAGLPLDIAPRPLPQRSTRVVSEESSPPFLTGPKRWDPKTYSASERPTRPERRSRWQSTPSGARSTAIARPARVSEDADDDLWLRRSIDVQQSPTFPFGCDPFDRQTSGSDAPSDPPPSTPPPTEVAASALEPGGGEFGGAGASGSWDVPPDSVPSPPSGTDP